MSFADLGLSPDTLKAVTDAGYETPTPIQEQAIPWVLQGRDVLGIAQTGTGKTAGFTLPMIDILAHGRAKARMPRSLILAPTRELANQVAENFRTYGKYHKLEMALLIGGESFSEQEKALGRGVDVLIATPGRLLDLFERGRILLRDVKVLVIDEADRMLDMGFIPDVERIVSLLPPLRQTLFFSATMDAQIRKLADAFLQNPKEVRVAARSSAAETVSQFLTVVDPVDKREALRHILHMEDVKNAFIFCNRKRDVGVLFRSLKKHGFDVAQLHGDMPQHERTATLAFFKEGNVSLMVCSDVAARGIDVSDVSHVFNFDVPIHSEDYVHRIGRTGRAGREGRAYTIAIPEDAKHVAAIEKLIGKEIPRIELEGLASPSLDEDTGRSRGRGRGGKDRDRGRRNAKAEQAAPRTEEPAREEPRREEPRREESRRDEPRRDEPRRESRRDERRDDRRGGGRRGRRDHPADRIEEMRHGDDVLAFGGHTPAFLLAPVTLVPTPEEAEARDAAEAAAAEAAEAAGIDTAVEVVETPVDEKPAKPARKRTRRGKKADEAATEATEAAPPQDEEPVPATEAAIAEAEEPVAPEAVAEPVAETAPATVEPAVEEKPKRKRAPRKKPEAAPADAAPVEGEEAAAAADEKPKRKRAPRKTKATEDTAAAATEEAPKRKRTPRKKAEAAPSEDAPAAEEKPKRKRAPRKKAEPDAEAPAADAAPESQGD